jgi:hypothetical protein
MNCPHISIDRATHENLIISVYYVFLFGARASGAAMVNVAKMQRQ